MKRHSWLFIATALIAILVAGCASVPVKPWDRSAVWISASAWEQKAHGGLGDFPPRLTFDGSLAPESSWRASGDGEWIQYDFGKKVPLKEVRIAFLKGDQRKYTFEILGNACCEAMDWDVLVGRRQNSGTSAGLESYTCGGAVVRLIRIVGHGNSDKQYSAWNCITEVDFVSE